MRTEEQQSPAEWEYQCLLREDILKRFSRDQATNRLHNVATCFATDNFWLAHVRTMCSKIFLDKQQASFPAISAWGSRRNKQKESTNVDTQYWRRKAKVQGVTPNSFERYPMTECTYILIIYLHSLHILHI